METHQKAEQHTKKLKLDIWADTSDDDADFWKSGEGETASEILSEGLKTIAEEISRQYKIWTDRQKSEKAE